MLAKLQRQERNYEKRGMPASICQEPVLPSVTQCETSLVSVKVRQNPPVSSPVISAELMTAIDDYIGIPSFLQRNKQLTPQAQAIADELATTKKL
jgi:hypothetical protein